MFPAPFEYQRAHSTDEAVAALAEHGADARVLAGGQSLIPAMRFRLARPPVLVDINPVEELAYITRVGRALGRRCGGPRFCDRNRALRGGALPSHCRCVGGRRRSGRAADGNGRRQSVSQRPLRRLAGSRAGIPGAMLLRNAKGTRVVPIDDFIVDSLYDRRR